jgi:hypothetical protein
MTPIGCHQNWKVLAIGFVFAGRRVSTVQVR